MAKYYLIYFTLVVLFQKLLNLFGLSTSSKVNKDEAKKFTNSPKGLYLYGGVGCGKTMLMDLFYDACPISHKKRIHFHAFMLDVHKRKLFLYVFTCSLIHLNFTIINLLSVLCM